MWWYICLTVFSTTAKCWQYIFKVVQSELKKWNLARVSNWKKENIQIFLVFHLKYLSYDWMKRDRLNCRQEILKSGSMWVVKMEFGQGVKLHISHPTIFGASLKIFGVVSEYGDFSMNKISGKWRDQVNLVIWIFISRLLIQYLVWLFWYESSWCYFRIGSVLILQNLSCFVCGILK